jgi:transposase
MHDKGKGPAQRKQDTSSGLSPMNPNAAGIDVAAECHFVAVPADRDEEPVRKFGAFTSDLYRLAEWLDKCGVQTVAMESTGVYWIPLFGVLEERGFEVILVDPHRLKTVPGRKTDVVDSQWLQQLHTFGLLAGAFRPAEDIRQLRSYLRQRSMLVEYASRHIQHMQKALTQMNVKLQHVVSDITGKTGMDIIQAIIAGERNPTKLAKLRDYRVKASESTIAKALHGHWRDEHLFELTQAVELYTTYQGKIAECDRQIEVIVNTFEDRSEGPLPPKSDRRSTRSQGNTPAFDARSHLYRMTGVDLTRIDGLEAHTVLKVVSEIGLDMHRWPTVKHFTSWLGLCPGSRITGGKVKSSRTKPSANRAAAALRLAANSLHRSDSALGAFFRRMKTKMGTPAAITATAHKLARLVYSMLKYGTQYVDAGQDYYERQYKRRVINNLVKRAKQLGYQLLELKPDSTPVGVDQPNALQAVTR